MNVRLLNAELAGGSVTEPRVKDLVPRIWRRDHTVWRNDPTGIADRLGWLDAPDAMRSAVPDLSAFASEIRVAGYTHVVLLGMGGSSLAAEVLAECGLRSAEGGFPLAVIDTTDPDQIRDRTSGLDPSNTLFIVATKSGGTVETLSAFKYFYRRVAEQVGDSRVGGGFVAITDPGSPLVDVAKQLSFRRTFLNDPTIGGRFSALSYFGLVPAALLGIDLGRFLDRAQMAAAEAGRDRVPAEAPPAVTLGVTLARLARRGRDKLTLLASPSLAPLGVWIEQLIAESTGKDGTGILPVVQEPVGPPQVYGDDRVFIWHGYPSDEPPAALEALRKAGHPVVTVTARDPYDLGALFFFWEFVTAVAGAELGVQPFDQPNVEMAKQLARDMVTSYLAAGALPADDAKPLSAAALRAFLTNGSTGRYVAIQAYLPDRPEIDAALRRLQARIRDTTRMATTVGYGPRYLHSTGQLHKGDGGNGLFVQLTCTPEEDLTIPDEPGSSHSTMTFGTLERAQALGDARALSEGGRRFIRFTVPSDVSQTIEAVAAALE